MKLIRKNLRGLAIIGGLIGSLNFVHAQIVTVGSFNGVAAPIQSAPPDSIVQVTAEAQGLPLLTPDQVPFCGTFWWVMPGGAAVPAPCPPLDLSAPIYQIADGQFLVDETGGQVEVVANTRTSSLQAASTVNAVTSALEAQATALVTLITQVQTTAANQQARATMQAMGMDVPFPGDGGTNSFTPDGASYIAPDYGTNVWIAQVAVSSGYLTGIGTNTLAAVQYEIQSRTNLLQSDWQSEGSILGSALTNWTPLSVAQIGRTNLFIRLKSWASSDASGLPDWWELEYFGTTGINPNAQDAAGDGWSNWQKFQMGLNPNVFYTPPAPQLAVSYGPNSVANASWLPAPGPVTGYTLERDYYDYSDFPFGGVYTQTFNLSSNTDSYADNLSGDNGIDPEGWGPSLFVSYTLTANYNGGNSPSSTVWLENSGSYIPLVSVYIIGSGSQETPYLVVPTLPPNTAALQLTRVDRGANAISGTFTVLVTAITNGLYPLPAAWEGSADSPENYFWWVQTISANGFTNNPTSIQSLGFTIAGYTWPPPFYDGRAQLKQNLIFLLRAANEHNSFQFTEIATDNSTTPFVNPTNYAYAGLYRSDNQNWGPNGYFDSSLPFEDNNQYRNFMLSLSPNQDIDGNGELTTGAGESLYYVLLLDPPTYQFQTPAAGVTNIPPLLATNVTQWLLAEPGANNPGAVGITINTSVSPNVYQMASSDKNIFGLQYLSTELAYGTGTGLGIITLSPNGSASPSATNSINIYSGTAQPQFQTREYDFWQRWEDDSLPGMPSFSPTNTSRFTIMSVGSDIWIAAYAKLAVTNGNSGVYGYLQQYFDQAYQIDTNGAVTANTTGILSPYGDFFATQPGPVALVTKPDLDTGARGTNIVYAIKLAVDLNHDGVMDLSFNGLDNTSPSIFYPFWVNNNYDRSTPDADDNTNYEDDVQIASNPGTSIAEPDCNYSNRLANGYSYRAIPTKRDLEDFTRLWVCGVTSNLLATMPIGSTVTLSWLHDVFHPLVGNPTIDLFAAADADGGIGYLTNETIAAEQTNIFQCPYIGRLGPGQSIQLNTIQFANSWAGNHFIWCGVAGGSGALTLTIEDANGNVLGQTSIYIQLVDIKQMYERWTVGDNPSVAPTSTPIPVTDGLPAGVSAFEYTTPTDTNTPYILFVHGWNMEPWEKDRFAETAFKRLYWQGYQGRFGEFRWPTSWGFTGDFSQLFNNQQEKDNFDNSEYTAWRSATGLLNKLNALNVEYPGHVYMLAHSMGNVVAGEALRLAGNNQVVNTYVASQAAVTAHTYDTNVANYSFTVTVGSSQFNFGPHTPNIYGSWFAGNNGGGAGKVVSFYNANDYALSQLHWQLDQLFKPDQIVATPTTLWTYGYSGSPNDPAPWNHFYKTNLLASASLVNFDIVNSLTNRYEVMAYAAQSYTTALGATPATLHLTGSIDLTRQNPQIWPPDLSPNPYGAHFWHSAEFRGDYSPMQGYWSELLGTEAFNLK